MGKKWSEKDIEYLRQNYGVKSLKELSEYFDTTISSVKHKAEREGIKSARQWTDEEIEFLKNNYKTKTYKELSQILNRSKSAIDIKINRLGLKKDKYTYNHDFFEDINTQEKAYWLGFIYADGCVIKNGSYSYELSIKLQKKDLNHLKKFNLAVDGNIECTTFNRICNLNGKYYEGCQIRFYSKKMVHDLMKHGVLQDKSLSIRFPNINPQLISHFVRGFFDGDGCLTENRHKNGKSYVRADFTCGSIDFITSLRAILYENGICSYITNEKDKNVYRLLIGGMKNCDNFFNYIYRDAKIYLDRKLDKKNKLYKKLEIEQRLLRQSEMAG